MTKYDPTIEDVYKKVLVILLFLVLMFIYLDC